MVVNHVLNGTETLYECEALRMQKATLTLTLTLKGKAEKQITGGKAFVMNDAGATVAVYTLQGDRNRSIR